ncbi:hypothetical protein AVANS14531_06760 [Campylobacter sp. Cr9]|nr:hypothetical protein [Campylobacter sp. Cr9]
MITEKERIELDMIFNSIRTSKKNMIKKYFKNFYKKFFFTRKKQYNHQYS